MAIITRGYSFSVAQCVYLANMTRRQKAIAQEKTDSEAGHEAEGVQDPPPETRRTRSGRTVRTPAALLDSEALARTQSRRTRRSVLRELPVVEEKNTNEQEQKPDSLAEEKSGMSAEPEPTEPHSEAAAAATHGTEVNGDNHLSRSAPAETAPTGTEAVPKKKPRLDQSGKLNPAVPLGKPKSGRAWKDRNKQR